MCSFVFFLSTDGVFNRLRLWPNRLISRTHTHTCNKYQCDWHILTRKRGPHRAVTTRMPHERRLDSFPFLILEQIVLKETIVSCSKIRGHYFFFLFSFISLIADGPHHYHPACGHKGSSHLSPVHALQFFYRYASSALLQLVNQWLNYSMFCQYTKFKIQSLLLLLK